jgi:hypothetical protein
VATTEARIKVEAVGNVFFDVSDADLTIQGAPAVSVDDPTAQYSDAVGAAAVVKARDDDSQGSALTATASGLPAGLSLAVGSPSADSDRPGTRTWALAGNVTADPGTYAGSVTVTDGDGEGITTPLTVKVTPEDAGVAYAGDTLSSGSVLLRATVSDSADGAPGDLGKATVTFKEGATTLCGPLAAGAGVVSCRVTLPPGSHEIDVVTGNYYTGATKTTVAVANPDDTHVVAIGNLIVGASAGTYKADLRSPLSFAVDAKFKDKKRGELKGLAEIVYLSGGKVFRISANRFESLGASADGSRVELRASADIWDYSGLLWPKIVARDVTLHVAVTEAPTPKKPTIAISVWDAGTLLFSLPEQSISGGAISIK